MTTFLTDLMKEGYTQDEVFSVIFESDRERKRRRMQAIVIETVGAHRLNKMKKLLTFEKLAAWRRMTVSIELQLTIICGLAVNSP